MATSNGSAPRPFMRACGRRPFGNVARFTISCWRGLKWRYGSGDERPNRPILICNSNDLCSCANRRQSNRGCCQHTRYRA
jgi:hypothetical protein